MVGLTPIYPYIYKWITTLSFWDIPVPKFYQRQPLSTFFWLSLKSTKKQATAEDWHVFHHQLGVSSLAAGNLTTAQHALQRAWQQRPDALTAKAMAKVLAAQGLGGSKGWQNHWTFQRNIRIPRKLT